MVKKVLFTATVDSHILHFHIPYLKLFKEKGYEVHVATNGDEKIPYCDVKHKISFERSPYKLNNLKAIKDLRKIVLKEKFDIIHTHTPMGSVVTRLASIKARKKGTKVFYTAHGFHFYKGASKLNWLIFYPVEKLLSKYTDCLITINKEDYDLAKDKFKKCNQIEYVPGVGIDEEKFNFKMTEKEKKDLRKSIGLKKDDFVLIQVGELNENKNQKMSIEAMREIVKKHKNVHLVLAGTGVLESYYKEKIKEYNLEENIHLLGYRKDVPKLLRISDVLLSLSHREGLPVNVIEAMFCGLPVIATNCRGNRDLVKNNKNGYLIDLEDNENFSKKVERLYKDKEKYQILKDNAKEEMLQYKLDNIMNSIKTFYFRKKRILHLLASNKYSGAENVVCTIIDNMKNEYEFLYCSPNGEIKEQLDERKILFQPLKKLSYFNIKKVIKQYKPDIVHAHDFKASCYASIFGKKTKIISHIHGNNIVMNTKNIKSILYKLLSQRINKIIWVSDSSLEGYFYKNNITKKSIVLYNVIDQNEIVRKSNLYKCKNTHDLIFLGRLAYPKNPERLIEIVKKLKQKKNDISLAIVGDGIDRIKIEQMVNEYNLVDNVTFYGFQSNPFPILKNSKILIMTSIYEGTPMCALEAQALGKPIVSTPVDGLKKIIADGENGYLCNENSSFIKNILFILKNNNIENFKDKSLFKFQKINNIENYKNIIKKIYDDVTRGSL